MVSIRNYTAAFLVLILGASVLPKAFLGPAASQANPVQEASREASSSLPKSRSAYASLATSEQRPSPGNKNPDLRHAAATAQVRWISIEEALALNTKKKDKKPIFIDLYTDWCGWCKRMDATTFQDPVLVAYLNEHYHCVKFNAEANGPFEYLGKEYALPSHARATHPFALLVGAVGGSIGYPTVVVLDADGQKQITLPGYQTAPALEPVLVYYAEGYHLEFDYATFQGMYIPKSGQ
jgi:thioredoxin-related protein